MIVCQLLVFVLEELQETNLAEVGDGGPRKAEETINGIVCERARQGGHRGEVLRGGGKASNGD